MDLKHSVTQRVFIVGNYVRNIFCKKYCSKFTNLFSGFLVPFETKYIDR